MSSDSGKKYSMEELMEKNKPIVLPKTENHPTEKEWVQMMALQLQTTKLLGDLVKWAEAYPPPPSLYGVNEHLTAMKGELKALRQTVEKMELAGRRNERRISLPRVSLPRPRLAWLWAIPILAALAALFYTSAIVWNNLLSPFLQLFQ
ncbi:MAG: hypothetical protein J6J87_00795 [Oscillospiraceae bacterium]|nr:hypothetical protein [Oscillospiraceae bacterium]